MKDVTLMTRNEFERHLLSSNPWTIIVESEGTYYDIVKIAEYDETVYRVLI